MKHYIDYADIQVPEGLPPTEYNPRERRADILRRIFETGDPYNVKQSELSEYYGVSRPVIAKDMVVLRKYLAEYMDDSNTRAMVQSAFRKCYTGLLGQGDYKNAWSVISSWSRWQMDSGVVEKAPSKISISSPVERLSKNELMELLNELLKEDEREED